MTWPAINMVKHWLQDIGCYNYIDQFLDNGYDDLEICKQIGIKDIDAIGIHDPNDRIRLLAGVESLKDKSNSKRPFYFVLENPKSPSFSLEKNERNVKLKNETAGIISNNNACSWACCATLSSNSSGTSDYASNCSHQSASGETDPLVHPRFQPFVITQPGETKYIPCDPDSVEIKEICSMELMCNKSSDSRDIQMQSSSSVEELGSQQIEDTANKDKTSRPSLRQSSSYTGTNNYHTVESPRCKRSLSESCYMMSAYGHNNRSVPPPLPRCPPPSGSCIDMSLQSDMDSITAQPVAESSPNCSERGNSFPRTANAGVLAPQHFDRVYWSSHGQPPGHRKHKGLARIFSFPKLTPRKYTYKPARGDLAAHEMTMSDIDRIQLMVMVKEGKLSMQQALNTVKHYEEDKKKGIHRNLSDYLQGDEIKIPVPTDKSSKPSPLRFLRSFSFRNSKRKKFLQDLEFYYKEQDKRQQGLVEQMAKMEICEDNVYSRPQCCNNRSCEENGQSSCRSQMSSPMTSSIAPCDTHQHYNSTCGNTLIPGSRRGSRRGSFSSYTDRGSVANYEMKCSASEMSFRGSPQYSVYNSPARTSRRLFDDPSGGVGGYPSPRFCRSESEPTYFDRTYGGRHSYHGVSPRRHSDIVTFVHHVQPSPVSAYNQTVCSKCQRQPVCDGQVMLPPCGGGYMNYGPSPCCRHRGVVTNVIAEECSPCLSTSSSIEDVNVSPRPLSVKANVHRADNPQYEDSINNNSGHQRRVSEVLRRSGSQDDRNPSVHQVQSQPWSSSSDSQQSISTESEPPIDQYKPKGHASSKHNNTSTQDENDNARMAREDSGGNGSADLQENYAQTSDVVINTTFVRSVQQLCNKLGLQHLLPVFLNNGFETLELFKQLEEQDLCMLGITDTTERAKVLTAVTLLPDDQEFVPTYKYKFTENPNLYSKINPLEVNKTETGGQQCVQAEPLHVNQTSLGVLNMKERQTSPIYSPALQTRDSGCYVEHLNNSNHSH